jgi:uncharacterized protein YciI
MTKIKTKRNNYISTIIMSAILILAAISVEAQSANPAYDSVLAKTLGADDYGMKWYVMVILKTGSNKIEDKAIRDSLFAGHLNNINRLAGLGKLVVAGPFGKNDNSYRGIFILNVTSFEEANELLQSDPAIKAKIFDVDMYKWYGSAAISEYLKYHEKIENFKIK